MPQLLASLNDIDPELLNPEASRPYGAHKHQIFYLFPYTLLFACVLPYQSVRLMSLRPDVKAHQLALIIAPISLLLSFVPFVGLYMRVKFPQLAVADEAMPMFLRHVVPPLASTIITLFILFAMQSTANSVLHVVSTSLSHDVRKALFPDIAMSSQLTLKVNQVMVIVVGLLTFVIMLLMPPLMLNMIAIMGTGTLVSAFAGPVLIGTFWKGTATGALWSIVSGFSVSGYLLLFADLGWVEPPIYGTITGSLVYLVASLLTMKKSPIINQKIHEQKSTSF